MLVVKLGPLVALTLKQPRYLGQLLQPMAPKHACKPSNQDTQSKLLGCIQILRMISLIGSA